MQKYSQVSLSIMCAHSEAVEDYALTIFDSLKELHGLESERILLRTAAILHDIGKYISLDKHHIHSYEIIKSIELFGMSKEQMEIVANISRYHSLEAPKYEDINFNRLSEKNRLKVAKLVAVLRLADSLDRSHKQKIKIQSVKNKDRKVIIKAVSNYNTKLEEWTFKVKSVFFLRSFWGNTSFKNKKGSIIRKVVDKTLASIKGAVLKI